MFAVIVVVKCLAIVIVLVSENRTFMLKRITYIRITKLNVDSPINTNIPFGIVFMLRKTITVDNKPKEWMYK